MIEADDYWYSATGSTRADFRRSHTVAEYRSRELSVCDAMLKNNSVGCVIVCGPGSIEGAGQLLLQDYAKNHPIIRIHRDARSIQTYLQGKDEVEVKRLLDLCRPRYNLCSNFQFFNISEKTSPSASEHDGNSTYQADGVPNSPTPKSASLTLKRTEQNYLRFLDRILGPRTLPLSQASTYTLSSHPLQSRPYTYVLPLSHSEIAAGVVDEEAWTSSVDAYELEISLTACVQNGGTSLLDNFISDSISRSMAIIRRNSIVPIIYHVHVDAGISSTQLYLDLLHLGLRLCPEYLSVDIRCTKEIFQSIRSACGSTKIIGHYTDTTPGEGGWLRDERLGKYHLAWEFGCDLVRLTQPANSMDDNLDVQQFHRKISTSIKPHPGLIAYNTGYLGRTSCITNPILSPVVTQNSQADPSINLSRITLKDAQTALYASFVLHRMHFCIFGTNVAHSLSPAMHNAALKSLGLPHRWSINQASALPVLNGLINDPTFGGAAIGLPYKSEIIPLLHSLSASAKAIGAVNTLIPLRFEPNSQTLYNLDSRFRRNTVGPIKALYGDNTDWIGLYSCVSRSISPANAVRPTTSALVIGGGGMARAAVYALERLGIQKIFIFNRTLRNAEEIAQHYNRQTNLFASRPASRNDSTVPSRESSPIKEPVTVLHSIDDAWPEGIMQPTVIISTLPNHAIGKNPAPTFTLPPQWLQSPSGGVFVQLAYEPVKSLLGEQMRAKSRQGWVICDGLHVLPEQGFAQFELFTGRLAPRRLMRMEVLRNYKGPEVDDPEARSYIDSRIRNLQNSNENDTDVWD